MMNEFGSLLYTIPVGFEPISSESLYTFLGAPVSMHTTMTPTVGMYVKKVGRTTGFTHGRVGAVNVTVEVSYNQGTATFVNQIYVTGTSFLQAGDSGSLLVTESGNYPVGLCFAGSDNAAFANPIQPVLQYFGATVIGY